MISGKEAKLAWASGQDVEYMALNEWNNLGGSTPLSIFDRDDVKFRLKPQTITINGIEVPKPDYIVDTRHGYDGCWEINIGDTYYLFKTEENYKQVVEALRQIFK